MDDIGWDEICTGPEPITIGMTTPRPVGVDGFRIWLAMPAQPGGVPEVIGAYPVVDTLAGDVLRQPDGKPELIPFVRSDFQWGPTDG